MYFFRCAKPWYGHCVHSLNIRIMSCPSKVPFKFPLPLYEVKIDCMYRVLLKFRQHKLKKIFTVNLTFTIWCQIINEYCVNFCGLLRKYELYSTGFLLFFREKSMMHTSYEEILQPWVYPYSFPHKERSHLQDSNQTMCEKSDPELFCRKA